MDDHLFTQPCEYNIFLKEMMRQSTGFVRAYPERGWVFAVNLCYNRTCGERAANRHNPQRPKQFRHLTRGFPDSLLESVRSLFDEIVVVDTGSTDRTREIAREFEARVFDFVWVSDFAAARNAALARATGDYAFWLDADDEVDPSQRQKLEALFDGLRRGDDAAHVIRCSCDPGPNGDGGQTVFDHIRLFPLREDVRCTYRVHEQILPALRRVNVPVRWTDISVRHTGYTDPALREGKLQRGCKILLEDLAERPDDPFVRFNLGSIAIERKD